MVNAFKNFKFSTSQQNTFMKHEHLLLLSSNATFQFFISHGDFYYNTNITTHTHPYFTTLLQLTSLQNQFYLIDLYSIPYKINTIFYIFNCFFTNQYISYNFVNTTQTITSISLLLKGAT